MKKPHEKPWGFRQGSFSRRAPPSAAREGGLAYGFDKPITVAGPRPIRTAFPASLACKLKNECKAQGPRVSTNVPQTSWRWRQRMVVLEDEPSEHHSTCDDCKPGKLPLRVTGRLSRSESLWREPDYEETKGKGDRGERTVKQDRSWRRSHIRGRLCLFVFPIRLALLNQRAEAFL
jgi:hypothetical protein